MFSILSAVLAGLFYILYAIAVLQGKTKPMIISWLIWMVNNFVLAVNMHQDGVSQLVVAYCVGTVIIFILSLKFGKVELSKVNVYCTIIGTLGIILSFLDARLGVTCALIVGIVASIPTMESVRIEPENESRVPWLVNHAAAWCSLLGTTKWTFSTSAVPITYVVVGLYFQYLLWRPRRQSPP